MCFFERYVQCNCKVLTPKAFSNLSFSSFAVNVGSSQQLSLLYQWGATFLSLSVVKGVWCCGLNSVFFHFQEQRTTLMVLVVDGNTFNGSEGIFNATFSLDIDTSGSNTDLNFSNNQMIIPFSLSSASDINVQV